MCRGGRIGHPLILFIPQDRYKNYCLANYKYKAPSRKLNIKILYSTNQVDSSNLLPLTWFLFYLRKYIKIH